MSFTARVQHFVEEVRAHRITPRGRQFLLHFFGTPSREDTWEYEENIPDARLLHEYCVPGQMYRACYECAQGRGCCSLAATVALGGDVAPGGGAAAPSFEFVGRQAIRVAHNFGMAAQAGVDRAREASRRGGRPSRPRGA